MGVVQSVLPESGLLGLLSNGDRPRRQFGHPARKKDQQTHLLEDVHEVEVLRRHFFLQSILRFSSGFLLGSS